MRSEVYWLIRNSKTIVVLLETNKYLLKFLIENV